jgi:hypothetical protein
MNNIPKVPPSHTLRENAPHDRTRSLLLSSQQISHKDPKGFHRYPIPPQLLRALLAKLISLLQGSPKNASQQKSPFKRKQPYKSQHNKREGHSQK